MMRNKRLVVPWFLTLFLSAIACSEHHPDPLAKPTPSVKTPPIGLDARPNSPTCKASEKVTASNALMGFQRITTAPLENPVELTAHAGKLYVLEQLGKVLRLNDDGATASLMIDVTSKVSCCGEAGLLGVAFHPKFATNGFVFLYYTAPYPVGTPPKGPFLSLLVRYKSNDGGLTLDPASEKIILSIDQPYSNHNGGTIAFGNDGFLYWGLGDGGQGGDPNGNGQKKTTLLAKMLRIDVDGGDPYSIPPTNPFASGVEGRPEIFALGLRNPYRWRFDTVTGALWAGDVGQGAREEIDKIVLGGNYGWNIREGKQCYATPTCDSTGLIDPVVDHDRESATVITGGVVYRGTGVPALTGKYIYGDFGTGHFYSIPIDDPAPTPTRLDEGLARKNPSAISLDATGEIVFLDYFSGDVLRVVAPAAAGTATPVEEMPAKLSDTGCVDPIDPRKPAPGVFPYGVNIDAWDDGATAERWFSMPANGVLRGAPGGRLALPPGSVALKTLIAEGLRLETQVLVARPVAGTTAEAKWDAYSYVWSRDQTNATLVPATETAASVALPSGRMHTVVSRPQCFSSCHVTEGGVPTIGLEAAQLDRDDVVYDSGGGKSRTGNPLATLEKLMMIDAPIPRDSYSPLPRLQGFDTAERRARGYLHANCAHCHRGDDVVLGIDLRFGITLRDTRLCGPPLSKVVPSMQALTTAEGRMPPLGTLLPDAAGIQLVSSWIGTITKCE